jgi:hypothetical protein
MLVIGNLQFRKYHYGVVLAMIKPCFGECGDKYSSVMYFPAHITLVINNYVSMHASDDPNHFWYFGEDNRIRHNFNNLFGEKKNLHEL